MKLPKYRHFKKCNVAFVEIAGKRRYLGKYDSPESRTKYQQILNELYLKRHGRRPANSAFDQQQQQLSVNELWLAYLNYAENYYRDQTAPIVNGS